MKTILWISMWLIWLSTPALANDVYIPQANTSHSIGIDIIGMFNTIDILQTSQIDAAHYLQMNILGNHNNIGIVQKDATKALIFSLHGDHNTVDIIQQGAGQSTVELNLTGDDAVVDVLQQGAGDHTATIDLENAGGTWNFSLVQSSDTNLTYSLPDNNLNGVCYVGVCNISVFQQQ